MGARRLLGTLDRTHAIAAPFIVAMTEFKRGAFKDKKVTYASTDRMEEHRRVADDFMMEVFDFLSGEYLITDESSLRDFTDSPRPTLRPSGAASPKPTESKKRMSHLSD